MSYQHLTQDERYQIDAQLRAGFCDADIARALGRHASTIARERGRNRSGDHYRAAPAQSQAQRRRHAASARSRLAPALCARIDAGLAQRLSPEQIRGRGLLLGEPMVSHTTIYRYVHRQGQRHQLRLPKRRRGYGRGRPKRFTDRKPIQQRPPAVDALARLGDWELDTVRPGKGTGVLVTMNERVSGFIRRGWSPNGTAEEVAMVITARLGRRLSQYVHTLTCDRGSEFADDAFIELVLDATMYFADPHAPWQRARNEHGNGLLRQYFPRHRDFSTITAEELQQVEDALNDRPRKRLKFLTPNEVFFNYDRLALQS